MSVPAVLSDPEKRNRFYVAIASGMTWPEASALVGIDPSNAYKFFKRNADAAADLEAAQAVAVARVEKVLYDAALNGEPWAVALVLKRTKTLNDEEPKSGSQPIQVAVVTLTPGEKDALYKSLTEQNERLAAIAAERRAIEAANVIDVEVLDE